MTLNDSVWEWFDHQTNAAFKIVRMDRAFFSKMMGLDKLAVIGPVDSYKQLPHIVDVLAKRVTQHALPLQFLNETDMQELHHLVVCKHQSVKQRINLDIKNQMITISGMSKDCDEARQFLTQQLHLIKSKEYPIFWRDKVRMATDESYTVQRYQLTTKDVEYALI